MYKKFLILINLFLILFMFLSCEGTVFKVQNEPIEINETSEKIPQNKLKNYAIIGTWTRTYFTSVSPQIVKAEYFGDLTSNYSENYMIDTGVSNMAKRDSDSAEGLIYETNYTTSAGTISGKTILSCTVTLTFSVNNMFSMVYTRVFGSDFDNAFGSEGKYEYNYDHYYYHNGTSYLGFSGYNGRTYKTTSYSGTWKYDTENSYSDSTGSDDYSPILIHVTSQVDVDNQVIVQRSASPGTDVSVFHIDNGFSYFIPRSVTATDFLTVTRTRIRDSIWEWSIDDAPNASDTSVQAYINEGGSNSNLYTKQ